MDRKEWSKDQGSKNSPGGVSLILGATKMRLAKVSDPHTKSQSADHYYLLRGGTSLGGARKKQKKNKIKFIFFLAFVSVLFFFSLLFFR